MLIKGGKVQFDSFGNEVLFEVPENLTLLNTKTVVPLPSVMISLDINNSDKVIELKQVYDTKDKLLFIAFLEEDRINTPLKGVKGVIARIVRLYESSDSITKIMLQGLERAIVVSNGKEDKSLHFSKVKVEVLADRAPSKENTEEINTRINSIISIIESLVGAGLLPEELLLISDESDNPARFCDVITAQFCESNSTLETVLYSSNIIERLEIAEDIISNIYTKFMVMHDIRSKAELAIDNNQHELFLREQIRQIQLELGDDSESNEVKALREKLTTTKLPSEVKKEVNKQLNRLESVNQDTSEYTMRRTYLEWVFELPWGRKTRDRLDPARAKRILDRDHFGLEKAKERVVEYLCVRRLNRSVRGPILCLVGPPGVGKTSLGRSVAQALGKKFYRMSLGGLRDEAEIRGHRRTYLGAMPGRIVQALKIAGSMNPVVLLDEIDKIGNDFRGDPASALLEVLDPRQNKEFRDHYINIPIDLSEVLFIATANITDTIPDALLDRLEVIQISGYTLEEKMSIASKFIVPRQLEENGLRDHSIEFNEDGLKFLIERYTEEAGVRNLEREVSALSRKIARLFVEDGTIPKSINKSVVEKILGTTKYDPEQRERKSQIGLAHGLAWTVNGGEIMQIEVSVASGTGSLTLTGQLGAIMQESAQAAVFYARSNIKDLKLKSKFQQDLDVHIHVPAGATPKDGPSAGITIVTALVSALSGKFVSSEVAMTGEITLRGNVLQVGGLKEKILAALRYGFKKIVIPNANIKDLRDIDPKKLQSIEVVPVEHVKEALKVGLLNRARKKDK